MVNSLYNVLIATALVINPFSEATDIVRAKIDRYDSIRQKFEPAKTILKMYVDDVLVKSYPDPREVYSDIKKFIFNSESDSLKFYSVADSVSISDEKGQITVPKTVELRYIIEELLSEQQ